MCHPLKPASIVCIVDDHTVGCATRYGKPVRTNRATICGGFCANGCNIEVICCMDDNFADPCG